MKRQIACATALMAAGVLLCGSDARAQTTMPEVTDIQVIGTAGDLSFQQQFIQIGHFELPTIDVDETVSDGTPDPDPRRNLWWDLEIKVTADPTAAEFGAMIAFDKDVRNNTRFLWTDYHMTLGMGLGPNFMESDEFDNLYFKTDPPPVEKSQPPKFANPPMYDEPNAPDNLWWFADPPAPGVKPGELAVFWLGINIPPSKFMVDAAGGPAMATITLRQHASIPEPTSLVLAGCVLAIVSMLRRRR
jgi:hypothetical protein